MADKVFLTDVGTLVKLDTGLDLVALGATNCKIVAEPPGGGVAVDLDVTIVENTKVQHQKTASTLNLAGDWELQSYIESPGGDKYHGDFVTLPIYEPNT